MRDGIDSTRRILGNCGPGVSRCQARVTAVLSISNSRLPPEGGAWAGTGLFIGHPGRPRCSGSRHELRFSGAWLQVRDFRHTWTKACAAAGVANLLSQDLRKTGSTQPAPRWYPGIRRHENRRMENQQRLSPLCHCRWPRPGRPFVNSRTREKTGLCREWA